MFAVPRPGGAIVLFALRDTETGINEQDVAGIDRVLIEDFQRRPGVGAARGIRKNSVTPYYSLKGRLERQPGLADCGIIIMDGRLGLGESGVRDDCRNESKQPPTLRS